jgi:peptidoglycan/xylan/chitin deacetylase (PgdA/CDA1 family)
MLIVSNYHYIREDFTAKHPSIFGLTPKQFRLQMEELSKAGSFISQKDLLEFRYKKFDKNYILITFDDGLKEQYELAKPILDAMGIPFIFFINTANFDEQKVSLVHKIHLLRSRLSSAEILRELSKISLLELTPREKALAVFHYNYDEEQTALLKYLLNFKMSLPQQQEFINPLFEQLFGESSLNSELYFDEEMLQVLNDQDALGSHSHNHVPLGNISSEELQKELKHTQDFFSQKFGKPAMSLSYPYGSLEASSEIQEQVSTHGFKLGFTMERAMNNSLEEDSLMLSRFDCNDMPLGKNELLIAEKLFQESQLRNWYKNENSITHKR